VAIRFNFSVKGIVPLVAIILLSGLCGRGGPPGITSAFSVYRPFAARKVEANAPHRYTHRNFITAISESSGGNDDGSLQDDIVLLSLTSTERWIEDTLRGMGGGDAYVRKEISYECETGTSLAEIMAGVFRRLREIREMGEGHGKSMELIDSEDRKSTLRLTSVLVMPSSKELREDFSLFDTMVERINKARRDARDYLIDDDLKEGGGGTMSPTRNAEKWITAVNLSHMHQKFGEDIENDTDEEDSEALKAYKEQRKRARQSPYPTVVFEVKSSPPQPMMSPPSGEKSPPSRDPEKDPSVRSEDVKRLEAMFGKTASEGIREADAKDDAGSDAAATAVDLFAKSVFSPIGHAQQWVVENDPLYVAEKSSFFVSDSRQVDGVYEFLLSMISSTLSAADTVPAPELKSEYVILHKFCSKSATSVEKFQIQLLNLIKLIPGLSSWLSLSNFHPEHLNKDKRSPAPILVLRWGSHDEVNDSADDGAFE